MANRIKELRQKNNMSQIRLSIELEVSQETVSAYENEKYYPSFPILLKMSRIFGVPIDYIMGVTGSNDLSNLTNEETEVVSAFRNLTATQKEVAKAYINGLNDSK